MQEILLDNQVLDCIKKWLEPNIRGHLAVHSLRKRLLELLAMLPIETSHLRESGLGRIVMFYYTRDREALDIRKLAGDLVATWSRPIIGTSLDYREMMMISRDGEEDQDRSNALGKFKQLQSDKFKKLARSGALDRGSGKTGGRYQRLTQTLNRQKKK
jgi:transcription factor SPN1